MGTLQLFWLLYDTDWDCIINWLLTYRIVSCNSTSSKLSSMNVLDINKFHTSFIHGKIVYISQTAVSMWTCADKLLQWDNHNLHTHCNVGVQINYQLCHNRSGMFSTKWDWIYLSRFRYELKSPREIHERSQIPFRTDGQPQTGLLHSNVQRKIKCLRFRGTCD